MPAARLILCGAVLLAASLGCQPAALPPPAPVAVRVVTLRPEPVTCETRYTATVREKQQVELSFKVEGTVAALLPVRGIDGRERDVHEGDTVTADPQRPLARLDDADYQRRKAVVEQRLAQAVAKERAAQATVTAARAGFERIAALRKDASVAQQVLDDTRAKKDVAEAELDAAQREIAAAKVELQQAEDNLRNCALFVPLPSAVVLRKSIERNERVMPHQPVFQIIDVSSVRVAFGVPDSRIDQFPVGQTVTVLADSFRGERFVGRVTKMVPAADLKTRTFEVEVTIDKPRGLKPGMVVTILVGCGEQMTLLPMTAVQRGAEVGQFAVFAVLDEDGRTVARKRRVAIDGVHDNRVRLVEQSGSAVGAGDVIVAAGAFRLSDGQEIRPVAVPEPPLRIGL